jgi:hypothetical protein
METNPFLIKDSKPNVVGDLIHDVIESRPPDKSLNDWAQSTTEAEYQAGSVLNTLRTEIGVTQR